MKYRNLIILSVLILILCLCSCFRYRREYFDNKIDKTTNFNAAIEWAKIGIKRVENNKQESASGYGSSLKVAQPSIDFINKIIKKYNITKIVDLGCGDWNWMQYVNLDNINYVGYDASPEIIKNNKEKYSKKISNLNKQIS